MLGLVYAIPWISAAPWSPHLHLAARCRAASERSVSCAGRPHDDGTDARRTGAPAVSGRPGQPVLPYPRGRRRRRWLSPYRIVLAAVLLSTLFGGLIYLRSPSQSLVVASVPYWNIDYGTTSVLSNRHTFSEMSPWIYGLNSSGQIVPQYAAAQAATVDAQLARLRAARIPLVPTLANVVQGKWVYQPVITDILHNPRLRAQHVAAIVALVQRQDYAGIDIDYEDLLRQRPERLHRLHHRAGRRTARQGQGAVRRPVRQAHQSRL